MRVEVHFGASELTPAQVSGRVVAVIDVLRASTTIAVALANGARAVVPLASSEEAILRSKSFGRSDVCLAGERRMLPIPGFDLGNSPGEFTEAAIRGKTVLITTTNGTRALAGVTGARDVIVASYVNFSVVLAMLRAATRGRAEITLLCAGREREFSLEDAACAGRYARALARRATHVELNDAARASMLLDERYSDDLSELFADAVHGRALAEAGFAADLMVCGDLDAYPVVPVYRERQITKLGSAGER